MKSTLIPLLLTTILTLSSALPHLNPAANAISAPDEAKAKACNYGWCGAPFCSPVCGPFEGVWRGLAARAADTEALPVPEELSEARKKKKHCNYGWCGAPFCSPLCGPHESDEELVERTAEPE
ncbi:hypothetical protein AOQ84DRAFT_354967 [Glonium stellatum]|uniref:Uncharacterized protein n=1 Tax=Glonium stellatum TaxID=574774 RepID=A0A8E2JRY6_9PEZI|nr:hypothetical protein AOQ84DRAFT_354967 [Glonium stellatum]